MKGDTRIWVYSKEVSDEAHLASLLLPLLKPSSHRLEVGDIISHGDGKFSVTIRDISAEDAAKLFLLDSRWDEANLSELGLGLVDIDFSDSEFEIAVHARATMIHLGVGVELSDDLSAQAQYTLDEFSSTIDLLMTEVLDGIQPVEDEREETDDGADRPKDEDEDEDALLKEIGFQRIEDDSEETHDSLLQPSSDDDDESS